MKTNKPYEIGDKVKLANGEWGEVIATDWMGLGYLIAPLKANGRMPTKDDRILDGGHIVDDFCEHEE